MGNPGLEAAADDLALLFDDDDCGAWDVDQLRPLRNLYSFLALSLPSDLFDLSSPAHLLGLLIAVDEYAKKGQDETGEPIFIGQKRTTGTAVAEAVGIMIRLYDDRNDYPDLLEQRWNYAGLKIGYNNGRQVRPNRDKNAKRRTNTRPILREYLGYAQSLLSASGTREEILRLVTDRRTESLSQLGLADTSSREPEELTQQGLATMAPPNWLSVIGETRTSGPPIYERPDDVAKVLAWLGGNGRTLLLAGDSGNGKSTIARESLKQENGNEWIVAIDASTPRTLWNTMAAYLTLPVGAGFQDVQQGFCTYIHTLPCQSLLFIDNAPDWDTVRDVAESIHLWNHRLLATAEHQHLIPSDFDPELIKVSPPGLDVAVPLVKWFRPAADDEAMTRFAEAVERRPRIIIDCLGMFDEETMSLEDMASSVLDDNAQLLEDAGTHTRSVHKLYGIYFERTLREKPLVALCLMVLAYLAEPVTPTSIAIETLVKLGKAQGFGTFLKSALTPMLRSLQARFLLEHRQDEVHMHGVTQRLFRQVETAKEYRLAVYQATIAAYLGRRPDFVEDSVMRPERITWMSPLERVVITLRPDELLALDAADSTAVVSDLRQGLVQLGKYHKFNVVVKHIFENNPTFLPERLLSTREGHREFKEWEAGFYDYGTFSRELAIKQCELDIDAKSFRDVLHQVQTMFRYAHASYQLDTFAMWMETHSDDFLKSPHCDAEGRYRIRYTHATALDWIGRSDEAERLCRETFKIVQMPPSQALSIARIGIGCASKCGDMRLTQRWMERIHKLQDTEEAVRVSSAKADYMIALGWFHRMMDDDDETRKARESFFHGACMLFFIGKRREALETYAESVQLNERLHLKVGEDDRFFEAQPSYSYFKDLDTELDEPHSANRLQLICVIANGLRLGFTEDSMVGVQTILDKAEREYLDMRTVHQAEATLMYIRHALGLEEDPVMRQRLFELQKQRLGPDIKSDSFNEWVENLTHTDPQGCGVLVRPAVAWGFVGVAGCRRW